MPDERDTTTSGLPEVTEIQRISPQPGDVLIARCEARDLDVETAQRVKDAISRAFPADVQVLIADKSWHFWVASKIDPPSARVPAEEADHA